MSDNEDLKWKIDPSFKAKLQPEEAKLIIEGAEKAFDDSIETSIRILERCTSLLQLIAGILIGLVTYSIGKWEKNNCIDAILVTAIAGMGYYFALGILFIYPNIRPTEYVLPGTQPQRLITDKLFSVADKDRLMLLYITKITNLQDGITTNRAKNIERWAMYKKSLNLLFYSPAILIIVYLASHFMGI